LGAHSEKVFESLHSQDSILVFKCPLFSTIFCTFAFRAFRFAICLAIMMVAFRCRAFLAFPPIKHEKQQEQHAVFLMGRERSLEVALLVNPETVEKFHLVSFFPIHSFRHRPLSVFVHAPILALHLPFLPTTFPPLPLLF